MESIWKEESSKFFKKLFSPTNSKGKIVAIGIVLIALLMIIKGIVFRLTKGIELVKSFAYGFSH